MALAYVIVTTLVGAGVLGGIGYLLVLTAAAASAARPAGGSREL